MVFNRAVPDPDLEMGGGGSPPQFFFCGDGSQFVICYASTLKVFTQNAVDAFCLDWLD